MSAGEFPRGKSWLYADRQSVQSMASAASYARIVPSVSDTGDDLTHMTRHSEQGTAGVSRGVDPFLGAMHANSPKGASGSRVGDQRPLRGGDLGSLAPIEGLRPSGVGFDPLPASRVRGEGPTSTSSASWATKRLLDAVVGRMARGDVLPPPTRDPEAPTAQTCQSAWWIPPWM